MTQTTNNAGLQLIESFEGLRLTSYQDSVGVWTIGYGHTKGVKQGQTITQQQGPGFPATGFGRSRSCS
jgi:lysozyme